MSLVSRLKVIKPGAVLTSRLLGMRSGLILTVHATHAMYDHRRLVLVIKTTSYHIVQLFVSTFLSFLLEDAPPERPRDHGLCGLCM